MMTASIAYLTSRADFKQVSEKIPVTKKRNPEKVDPPEIFEGEEIPTLSRSALHPFLPDVSYPSE